MSEFEKIAQEVVRKAEAVKCPFRDFVEGLRSILIDVRERLEIAEDELRAKEREEEE